MAYSNAIYYLDLENGSDTTRATLSAIAVADNGAGAVRCTKVAHGLVTGSVGYVAEYDSYFKVTVLSADVFDLDTSVYTTATAISFEPNGGATKADAWRTFTSGAASYRVDSGDTVRVMATPDETLVGSATWVQASKNITLASAVTANICDCETVWTASANVTPTASTTIYKEGTKSCSLAVASAFATGKAAYFATGLLNLSAYEQVSFWYRNSVATAAGALTLRLCSDTTGDVTVHTIAIPALAATAIFTPVVVDLAAPLSASIQSIALYVAIDLGATTNTIILDNIIACKAASSPDALTLASLIGKVHNKSWVASAAYALGDKRRPSQPQRNGFQYVVSVAGTSAGAEPAWPVEYGLTVVDGTVTWVCTDIEDTWYPIQSINGTTVKVDNETSTVGNAGKGQMGALETVPTYKRDTFKMTAVNSSATVLNTLNDSGVTFSGGWDRTSMATQNGETWLDGRVSLGRMFAAVGADTVIENLNAVRASYGVSDPTSITLRNCQFLSMNSGIFWSTSIARITATGLVIANCNTAMTQSNFGDVNLLRFRIENNNASGLVLSGASYVVNIRLSYGLLRNHTGAGLAVAHNPASGDNLSFSNNTTGSLASISNDGVFFLNSLFSDATTFVGFLASYRNAYIWSQDHNRVKGANLGTTEGGTISSATDQLHTSGPGAISWKFQPTSLVRVSTYPLRLALAKTYCDTGVTYSATIWTRRNSTSIHGRLKIAGGQVAGIPVDIYVDCNPAVDTWEESTALTFTATDYAVIEITFEVYDGTQTTNSFWIDDLVITS